jgi:hypothetical protein
MVPLIVCLSVASGVMLAAPRIWAAFSLIAAGMYLTRAEVVSIGGAGFSALRLLILVGLCRLVIRGDRPSRFNALDGLMLAWGGWLVASVVFHSDPQTAVLYRARLALDGYGLYFIFRALIRSREDLYGCRELLAFALVPLALEMVAEHLIRYNLFSVFGAVDQVPAIRDGVIRAQGPFGNAILAGTWGAMSLPFTVSMWNRRPLLSAVGSIAGIVIVLASSSSGPVMTAATGLMALLCWRLRYRMRMVRWAAVLCYVALAVVMKVPPYYLMGRIDLTGSSTGYHRARLIEASIEHLRDWWLIGTDYTRHWMPTGIGIDIDPSNTDITNHYLQMGVLGGLPLLMLFLAVVVTAFVNVGRDIRAQRVRLDQWDAWAIGSTIFAMAVTFVSVSYFDQSVVFLYLALAASTVPSASRSVTSPENAAAQKLGACRVVPLRFSTRPARVSRRWATAWRAAITKTGTSSRHGVGQA